MLIYRLGSLGDTVVALPCFHLIARAFPRAERRVLTNFPVHAKAPAIAAVLQGTGLVHSYMSYVTGSRNLFALLRLAWKIRRFRPDLLVYLTVPRGQKAVQRDAAFFRFCGIRRIVGLPSGDWAENQFDPATGLWERESMRLLRLIGSLGHADPADPRDTSLHLSSEEKTSAAQRLASVGGHPILACGPGTKMQSKDWGKENWRELLSRLAAAYPRHALVLIGASEDIPVAEFASAGWSGPLLNLCGRLTPRETAAVLAHAAVFLGPDSGPMHLAANAGVPCVIAFSAAGLPGVWFPQGSQHQVVYHQTSCHGCYQETCIVERRRCLTSITVDEMTEAVARVLGPSAR